MEGSEKLAGRHEMLNWHVLTGAMAGLNRKPESGVPVPESEALILSFERRLT